MLVSSFMIFLSLAAYGQQMPQVELVPAPKTLEDYEHQHKGCPENSECDAVMGLQMGRWMELVSKVMEMGDGKKKAQFLELFRSKYGIPVEFFTLQKSQQGFKPLLFDSSCKHHNPKKGEKILRGIAFVKSLSEKSGIIWRDQTQIEVPVGELLVPQPVHVFKEKEIVTYLLPLGDQPLFIKDEALFVLREENGFFYFLKVSKDGSWKIENINMTFLSQWSDKKELVACPGGGPTPFSEIFKDSFCKTVWDEDAKKVRVVKMHLGCPT